jgi:hypothetical protein
MTHVMSDALLVEETFEAVLLFLGKLLKDVGKVEVEFGVFGLVGGGGIDGLGSQAFRRWLHVKTVHVKV